ncbi:hypothetical protein GGI35DRAFT_267474 [Trichoderma velutinum]
MASFICSFSASFFFYPPPGSVTGRPLKLKGEHALPREKRDRERKILILPPLAHITKLVLFPHVLNIYAFSCVHILARFLFFFTRIGCWITAKLGNVEGSTWFFCRHVFFFLNPRKLVYIQEVKGTPEAGDVGSRSSVERNGGAHQASTM